MSALGPQPASISSRGESGQAAVETALTMPLLLFIVLGVMQMGMIMQARNLTQYSVYRATRAGSLNHGNCQQMMHAAVASLIPSFVSFAGNVGGAGSMGSKLGATFARVIPAAFPPHVARFDPALTGGAAAGFTEPILWMVKEQPTLAQFGSWSLNNGEFSDWDQGERVGGNQNPVRLEVQMIYWYPMRLPLVDWVFSRMMLAQWGLMPYGAQTPYMPVRTATNWSAYVTNPFSGNTLEAAIKGELMRRHNMKQYTFPLMANYRMRMMTPPRIRYFFSQTCGF